MRLKNISPLGHLDLPLIGRVLEPGEVFEVPDDAGAALLDQPSNYAKAPATKEKTK
ncbi:MAG TPA: hypothetical protein PLX57_11880 [Ornithinibacter sp.]|jgi:hypothetical protein|nr:hypothetical protein [Ornithinibacter sp.]